MADKRVVLVDGVAGYWGGRVAARLGAQPDLHVIGLDADPPPEDINGLDFIQADIRNPLLVELLKDEAVDTVCHLAFDESTRPSETSFDVNVMGTMKVFGACAEANVRKIVFMSSTMVYGAEPMNSAFLREEHPLNGKRSNGTVRDLVEAEGFISGFRGQALETLVTVLRFAHVVGPKCDTSMTRFLREETAPVLMGFDPMMQVIHEDDVVSAIVQAVHNDVSGTFNVAAEHGVPLFKLIGLAGKLPIPILHPLAYFGASLLGPGIAPIDLNYLRYPCIGDLRRMRTELEFTPQYTSEETLREFAAQQRLRQYMPEAAAMAFDEQRLRDTIERRRRARELAVEQADRAGRPRRRKQPARVKVDVSKVVSPVDMLESPLDDYEENGNG
jgi:UDP-glucose 4-epimerase